MAAIEQGEEVVGFEEGVPWLPSNVLDEAIPETKQEYYGIVNNNNNKRQQHAYNQQFHSLLPKLPLQPQQQQPLHSKSNPRPKSSRTRYPTNWASGGSGMQAIFLDSGKQSCGTGVFLPRRAGTNLPSSKKPACSPVLLPARVVQALNLNVYEIGVQISRRQDAKNISRSGDCNLVKNKNGKDASGYCSAASQNENCSPEIFLPKEWTY